MKLQILNDLHIEWHKDQGKSFINSLDPSGIDVLLLSGDIVSLHNVSPLYQLCDRYKKVVYIIGNHELYGMSVEEGLEIFNNLSHPNLTTLDNSLVEINGQRFLGSTLWFSKRLVSRYGAEEHSINDFRRIENFKPWVYEQHERSVAWLKDNVKEGDVVMTHHIPSSRCIHPKWRMNALNGFFASNQDDIIIHQKPKYWFYGHGHDSGDMFIASTRLINNAFGYAGYEENPDFNDKLVIEL